MTTGSLAPTRRTQAERSDATRARLLDATLELLVEVGYGRTTSQAVAERAGLSRGAQLHHFPTKADLVLSAVRHLAAKRDQEIRAEYARAGGSRDLGRVLASLSTGYQGPLFLAALELWVAARTEPELREAVLPIEREIGLRVRDLCCELIGGGRTDRQVRIAADLTLDLLRGMGMNTLLHPPEAAMRRFTRLLSAWRTTLTILLDEEETP